MAKPSPKAAPQPKSAPKRRKPGPEPDAKAPTLRVLPILIVVAAVVLTVRVNDLRLGWDGASLSFATLQAQQPENPLEQTPPGAAPTNDAAAPAAAPAPAAAQPVNDVAPPPRRSDKPAVLETPDLSQTEMDVLQKLTERRNALDAREKELDSRETMVKAALEQLDRKIAEMKTLGNTIEGSLRQYNDQEDSKMRSLVKIYENMKSKEAARIFEQLDMPILLEVVERMKEQRVAPILAEMDPTKARIVTAELAQRRQIPLPKSNPGG